MQNFIYEMQRTFRSKLVIVMMIIIILASSLVAYGITGPGSPKPVIKPSMTHAAQAVIFNIMNAVFLFLIPVLAIFEGYIIYGKDRTNGVLESVVTRPTTKGQILFSRFFACAASIFIGLLLSTLIIDAGVASYYATGLPLSMMLALIAAYLVAGAAFIGLVFLLSHLVKSQTSVLGLAITIFLVMVIFWDTITFLILILALKLSPGTIGFGKAEVILSFINPAYFGSNVVLYATDVSLFGGFFGTGINPAAYGVTLTSLVAVGIAWMALPILSAYAMAKKFD